MWGIFRQHHYLSADFNKAAKFYLIYWDDVLVGMFSTLAQPNGRYKYAWRVHRMVILPDFQGLGIGTKMVDFFGEYYLQQGLKLYLKSTHIRLSMHCRNDQRWLESSSSGKAVTKLTGNEGNKYKNHYMHREAYSFEYVGSDYSNKPEKVIKVDSVTDIEKFKNYISNLKEEYYVKVITGVPAEDNDIEIAMKELGVRTEQLYYKKNGELVESNKYKNYEKFDF